MSKCLDMMVVFNELQQQKFALARELKAVEAAPTRRGDLLIVREISVVVLDDKDGTSSSFSAVEGRRSLQATVDFEASFKDAGAAAKDVVVDPEYRKTRQCL